MCIKAKINVAKYINIHSLQLTRVYSFVTYIYIVINIQKVTNVYSSFPSTSKQTDTSQDSSVKDLHYEGQRVRTEQTHIYVAFIFFHILYSFIICSFSLIFIFIILFIIIHAPAMLALVV